MLGGTVYGTGRVVASQKDAFWLPRTMTRRYVVLALHGTDKVGATGLDPVATPGWHETCRRLADNGCVVVQADWDLNPWGNDTVVGHIDTFRSGLATTLASLNVAGASVLDTSKVVLLAGSQGGVTGFRYAEQHPSNVAGVAAIAPAVDLQGVYSGTYRWTASALGSTLSSQVEAAYGVTYPAALPSTADPYANANLAAAVPAWIGHSTADTSVPSDWATNMVSALGVNAQAVQVSTSAAHGDPEFVAALSYGITDWLIARAT